MKLTPCETTYLILACYGGAMKDHARSLDVSIKTVQKHRNNILHKLGHINGSGNVATLRMLQYAINSGLVDLGKWLKSEIK